MPKASKLKKGEETEWSFQQKPSPLIASALETKINCTRKSRDRCFQGTLQPQQPSVPLSQI